MIPLKLLAGVVFTCCITVRMRPREEIFLGGDSLFDCLKLNVQGLAVAILFVSLSHCNTLLYRKLEYSARKLN